MDRALNDPREGYYARRILPIGRGGDFTTAPMMGHALSRAIAGWAGRAMQDCGCRHLVEIGPGEGVLAAQILRLLPWRQRFRTKLHLVETSGVLAARQKEILGKRPQWHADMAAALASAGGDAVIYSNELVDAFPVRRFEKTPDGWQEIVVAIDNSGRATESLLPPAPSPASSAFTQSHPLGQRVEIHDSYRRQLESWLPSWKSGRLLTIDYGSAADSLYHRRPAGTVRAYSFHQRLDGLAIYQNPGRQDLTADVNFTDLQLWSEPWTSAGRLTTLADFLRPHTSPEDPLLNPDGVGGAFLVLDQNARTCGASAQ